MENAIKLMESIFFSLELETLRDSDRAFLDKKYQINFSYFIREPLQSL